MFDAVRHVIPQPLFLDAPQRGAPRGNLRDDIDAVAILVDHFRQAADLAFDPAQALLTGSFDVFSHPAYIPLLGMGYKWTLGRCDDRKNDRLLRRGSRSYRPRPWRPSWP